VITLRAMARRWREAGAADSGEPYGPPADAPAEVPLEGAR